MDDKPFGLRLVYSSRYDIRFWGIERLHPFDARKYSRAWNELRRLFGSALENFAVSPSGAVDDATLLRVHDTSYLRELGSPRYLERALELPNLRYIPAWLLRRAVLLPMRWSTAGTILASRLAIERGAAVNFSGGYHHASPGRGEGFCIYSDVPVAVAALRAEGRLCSGDRLGLIDLDAHQGNGFERAFMNDSDMVIFDLYNRDVYPGDHEARRRIDVDVGIRSGVQDGEYLESVSNGLSRFFDRLGSAKLVFYNAGTDIFSADLLGCLAISLEGIFRRDVMVFTELINRKIPFVVVPSGGYSRESYSMIARSVAWLVGRLENIQLSAASNCLSGSVANQDRGTVG